MVEGLSYNSLWNGGSMEFTWDERKNRSNIRKHGIDFASASGIFDGRVASTPTGTPGVGEDRVMSIGRIGNATITVVHTEREGTCRIISARKASRKERVNYEEALQKAADTGGTGGDA